MRRAPPKPFGSWLDLNYNGCWPELEWNCLNENETILYLRGQRQRGEWEEHHQSRPKPQPESNFSISNESCGILVSILTKAQPDSNFLIQMRVVGF